MGAFDVVTQFEDAIGEFTGAPNVVCVDSCTNAIFLSMLWCWHNAPEYGDPNRSVMGLGVDVPKHTYVGVVHAVRNAGFSVQWMDKQWWNSYRLDPYPVWDSAKYFERGMYEDEDEIVCVSFHIAKRLPLGKGGAILTHSKDTATWLRRARFDGRTAGETGESATHITSPGYHMQMAPDVAARGLWLLEQFVDKPLNAGWQYYPDLSQLL